jgi:hypothetical protein
MPTLKYYDGSDWQYAAIGKIGPTGPTGPTGVAAGLPTGGATGTLLSKTSSTDYDTQWVDPGTVGGLVHINTKTFSASTAESFDGIFTSNYLNYRFFISGVGSTALNIQARLRASNADNTTGNYGTIRNNQDSIISDRFQTSFTNLARVNSVTEFSIVLDVINPQITAFTTLLGQSFGLNANETAYITTSSTGYFEATTAFDGIKFYPSTGNFTGRLQIFAYNKI